MENSTCYFYIISGKYSPGGPGDYARIGATIDPPRRLYSQFNKLKNNEHNNSSMNEYYREFGLDGFVTGIIGSAPVAYKQNVEAILIHKHNTFVDCNQHGWNKTPGFDQKPDPACNFRLVRGDKNHFFESLYGWYSHYPEIDVSKAIDLREKKIIEWDGWRLYSPDHRK